MNFYFLSGRFAGTVISRLTLDKLAQEDLTAMLGSRATEMVTGEHIQFAAGYRPEDGEIVSSVSGLHP